MHELYLIRHGETEWNRTEVFRGRTDIPLNDRGLLQAQAASAYYASAGIDAIYSSPLQRARQTAREIAAPHGLDVIIDERFTDIHCGLWQGRTLTDVQEHYPDLYKTWEHAPQRMKMPGGESLQAVRRRSVAALKSVVDGSKPGKIMIISHRVIIKVLILALLGLGNSHFWQIRQDTACSNTIAFSDDVARGVLLQLNNTTYLEGLKESVPARDF
jgi:phosphoserine phosphatase